MFFSTFHPFLKDLLLSTFLLQSPQYYYVSILGNLLLNKQYSAYQIYGHQIFGPIGYMVNAPVFPSGVTGVKQVDHISDTHCMSSRLSYSKVHVGNSTDKRIREMKVNVR